MKRSVINGYISEAIEFFQEHRFLLPPFAHWTPQRWSSSGVDADEIVQCQLGWDVTDFGTGNYLKQGLLLFTIRNGLQSNLKTLKGKTYAEKIMIIKEGQVTPWHYHWEKMEDIINRGGGDLVVVLAHATDDDQLADTEVEVMIDGSRRKVAAQAEIALKPGESITLPPKLYHSFWAAPGRGMVLTGEVSQVNDDNVDNKFLDKLGRFPEIEEDAPPLRVMVGDYAKYYKG
jgi:D-lyxose ketol-isomerase